MKLHKQSLALLVLIVLGVGYLGYNMSTAPERLPIVCAQVVPGMSLQALQDFASTHGLRPAPQAPDGVAFLFEVKSGGVGRCEVSLASGLVTKSRYLAPP